MEFFQISVCLEEVYKTTITYHWQLLSFANSKKKLHLDFLAVGFILTGCMIGKVEIPKMASDCLYEASSYEKTTFLV